jgi:two-component system, OmpR family, sensor kinase
VSLRVRLTAALLLLVVGGLVVADVATYTSLRSFLLQRVDQQLPPAQDLMLHVLATGENPPGTFPDPSGEGPDPTLPTGTYVAVYDSSGARLAQRALNYGGTPIPPPSIPTAFVNGASSEPVYATVGAAIPTGPQYRAMISTIPDPSGTYTVAVAIPLTEVARTLHRVVTIALIVTLAVVAAMALLSWWTVRRELRPLVEIEQTAGAIAAGDLSQRVEGTDPRTEVGRLGGALNVMLGRIEEAMSERRASEEALRRFLADASHELRTPLTSIRGYAELFRRGAEDDPNDTALAMRRIEEESGRMGVLVEDLLFLARAGQGRPIASEPVDLARVASDAVHDARAVDPTREIELEAPGELVVAGDEGRLRQVAANLISNALTHTPAGTPVAVRVTRDDGWATLEVADHGPGLAPDEASRIFDPFYRADPARERQGAERGVGTGLGLAIVAAIAEAQGGSASVETAPGRGATFRVRIPVQARAVEGE